jgi:lipoyl(octanoyl) transferase
MDRLLILDVGLKPYQEVLTLQEKLFNKNIDAKLAGGLTENYLILCEHQPVFTLGKSGKRENILVSDAELNAEYYHVNRGGDVTFHGPGQLVVYPVLDLDSLQIGLAQYIFQLEDAIIRSLESFGLKGERMEGAAGIWIRTDERGPVTEAKAVDRKVGAIGVKASRNVTMHGIAVNVSTDLSWFDKIRACGLEGKGTTSIQKELGHEVSIDSYKKAFVEAFQEVFNVSISDTAFQSAI